MLLKSPHVNTCRPEHQEAFATKFIAEGSAWIPSRIASEVNETWAKVEFTQAFVASAFTFASFSGKEDDVDDDVDVEEEETIPGAESAWDPSA